MSRLVRAQLTTKGSKKSQTCLDALCLCFACDARMLDRRELGNSQTVFQSPHGHLVFDREVRCIKTQAACGFAGDRSISVDRVGDMCAAMPEHKIRSEIECLIGPFP